MGGWECGTGMPCELARTDDTVICEFSAARPAGEIEALLAGFAGTRVEGGGVRRGIRTASRYPTAPGEGGLRSAWSACRYG